MGSATKISGGDSTQAKQFAFSPWATRTSKRAGGASCMAETPDAAALPPTRALLFARSFSFREKLRSARLVGAVKLSSDPTFHRAIVASFPDVKSNVAGTFDSELSRVEVEKGGKVT